MALELKPFAYLEVEETLEFLKIPKHNEYRNQVIRLINMACQKVEDYIDGPVIARQYTEFRDGNSSNVIVPTFFPVKEVVEIKIDFNRAFDVATALAADNYVLRGIPSLGQQASLGPSTSLTVTDLYEIDGTDIVIRDDSNTAILGRLFTGSIIQSIKLTYKAGLAKDKESVPDTVKYATLLICDHFYMARENRDLHLKSKGTMGGQSYSKDGGLPKEIEDLLQDFKDYSLGPFDVPQRNTFGL
jgi:hypothetical protein